MIGNTKKPSLPQNNPNSGAGGGVKEARGPPLSLLLFLQLELIGVVGVTTATNHCEVIYPCTYPNSGACRWGGGFSVGSEGTSSYSYF